MDALSEKIERNSKLFDDLSLEIYYGFNMKVVLSHYNDAFLDDLEVFVKQCKSERDTIRLVAKIRRDYDVGKRVADIVAAAILCNVYESFDEREDAIENAVIELVNDTGRF